MLLVDINSITHRTFDLQINFIYIMAKEKTDSKKRQHHKQIAERSFKTVFDQYLFYRFSRGMQTSISAENFKSFDTNQKIINEYVNEYWQKDYTFQKKGEWTYDIKQIETHIYEWEHEKKNEVVFNGAKEYYVNTRFKDVYPYDDFKKLLEIKTCKYCDISEEEIAELISRDKINKKKVTRGWTLEIDRKEPNLEYTEDNCVRCCYWCNSAKTDEFDDKEFKPIGDAIKRIWDARLSR